MKSKIAGLGAYLPEKIYTNADLEKMVDTSDEWITTRTGIRQRHIAAEDEYTTDLATRAALQAVEDAKIDPSSLDAVILATITPDFMTPSSACTIAHAVGAGGAAAFDLSAGCSGFLYALSIGDAFIRAGSMQNVLVIGCECLSKITDWTDRNTCVLFGDGAGAAVLSATNEEGGVLSVHIGADGGAGSFITLQNLASPAWDVEQRQGQRGDKLYMNGNAVYKFAVKTMVSATKKALELAGLSIDDLAYIIPHQANERIIDAAARRLGVADEKVIKNLENTGNISAACIPVALRAAKDAGKLQKGDKIAMVGFGSGLTWASAVVEW